MMYRMDHVSVELRIGISFLVQLLQVIEQNRVERKEDFVHSMAHSESGEFMRMLMNQLQPMLHDAMRRDRPPRAPQAPPAPNPDPDAMVRIWKRISTHSGFLFYLWL